MMLACRIGSYPHSAGAATGTVVFAEINVAWLSSTRMIHPNLLLKRASPKSPLPTL
jgi:hypothetical protein